MNDLDLPEIVSFKQVPHNPHATRLLPVEYLMLGDPGSEFNLYTLDGTCTLLGR